MLYHKNATNVRGTSSFIRALGCRSVGYAVCLEGITFSLNGWDIVVRFHGEEEEEEEEVENESIERINGRGEGGAKNPLELNQTNVFRSSTIMEQRTGARRSGKKREREKVNYDFVDRAIVGRAASARRKSELKETRRLTGWLAGWDDRTNAARNGDGAGGALEGTVGRDEWAMMVAVRRRSCGCSGGGGDNYNAVGGYEGR